MAIVRIVNGEPRMAWYWGVALWFPTGGLVIAVIVVPLMMWALSQPRGTVSPGLIIGVTMGAVQASLLAGWFAVRRLLRQAERVEVRRAGGRYPPGTDELTQNQTCGA
jgi:cytosine/uracil/thiamine/allantoin permease